MTVNVTRARFITIVVFMLLTGLQLGLWLADYYDDGVHDPLSGGIGVAMLIVGIVLVAKSLTRRG